MVKKKTKAVAKLKRSGTSRTEEDVAVHTGLPPHVEGQLRCFLKLSVNQILWLIPAPPSLTQVRAQWWGEDGEGTIFRPIDVKKGDKVGQTTARYAIRSGPKQLAAYLTDMGCLALEVLSGATAVTVGRAQVEHISLLAPNRPINGFFAVFSADNEKIAELQVSIVLESLMTSYDSGSSAMPTPDHSVDFYAGSLNSVNEPVPINAPRVTPTQHPQPVYTSAEDPFKSPKNPKVRNSIQESFQSSTTASSSQPPRCHKKKIRSRSSSPAAGKGRRKSSQSPASRSGSKAPSPVQAAPSVTEHSLPPRRRTPADVDPTKMDTYRVNGSSHPGPEGKIQGINKLISETRQMLGMGNVETATRSQPASHVRPETAGSEVSRNRASGDTDLVSLLLQRGSKLRDAMIVSALDTQPPAATSSSGSAYPIKSHPSSQTDEFNSALVAGHESGNTSDMEARTVDLVVGSQITDSHFQILKAMGGSPASSISADDFLSDPGDPLHDTDILEELFYKQAAEESDVGEDTLGSIGIRRSRSSASIASLEEAGNKRPPSRNSSCSSLTLEREPVLETDAHRKLPAKQKLRKKKSRSVSGERRSRVRKRRGSKHSRGEASDSDAMSVSRMSDSSRVSFDPVLSDAEDMSSSVLNTSKASSTPEGLSIQRLTLLGRVHVARVVIDQLIFNEEALLDSTLDKNERKPRVRGKPPTPRSARKNQTYFVEYQFPVVATSRDKYQPNAMATEVMRVASKKTSEGGVSFNHRSVFPVLFDEDAIEKWWKSALIFKLYAKSTGQKVPKLLGMCSLPLKAVVQSEALYLDQRLEVKDRSKSAPQSSKKKKSPQWPTVGTLKLSVELASDSKDFSTALAKTRLAEMTNPKIVPIPNREPTSKFPTGLEAKAAGKNATNMPNTAGVQTSAMTQTEPRPVNIHNMPMLHAPLAATAPNPAPFTQNPAPHLQTSEINTSDTLESLTLHTLLMVPLGQGIYQQGTPSHRHGDKNPSQPPQPVSGWMGRDQATRNVYLVCRMFWCDDITRSSVCWGSHNPEFNFTQVAPMLLTASLLERMRNNVMVIEVWDKKTSADNDQLVGIVKLPLHQFYMSYRDRKISNSLLKSMYPVVSVDTDVPVINPFSAAHYGQLTVLLAMGSAEQVSNLQRLKMGKDTISPERPLHSLERQNVYQEGTRNDYPQVDNVLEHVFEVGVEGIKGLQLLENMIWGEADCFIQYHFPVQTQTRTGSSNSMNILHATPSMKTFRTATTLCIPDPVFNDVLRHKVSLPEGTPVQREILTACAGVGGGAGGIPFEVWCRYYYPNTRDQVIAKALLPLAKLAAMVTMQKRGEPSVQTFTLPLTTTMPLLHSRYEEEGEEGEELRSAPPQHAGLLEVTVTYRSQIIKGASSGSVSSEALSRSLPAATVCLTVAVNRAAGLKAAALALCRHEAGLQYAAEVGVNSYVRVKLSYLQQEDERITRTVARTFAPDLSYHLDFPSPLLWTDPGSDALSLAEILEHAEASFEIWHQVPHAPEDFAHRYVNTGSGEVTGRCLAPLGGDILLGTTTVPLNSLLKRKTGIAGWFPVNVPSVGWDGHPDQSEESYHGDRGLERVVGGLELSIKFAHHDDLERVVHAGRGVGWCPDYDIEHWDWESMDERDEYSQDITVSVDLACFPLANALITGQPRLDKAAHCYIRYKLYDRGAKCSRLRRLVADEDGESYLTCQLQHEHTLVVPSSSPFKWYLCEERLEIQVWVTYQSITEGEDQRKAERPNHRDKLIGSAYLDLAPLADPCRRSHRISGVYPLFKPGTATLGGACIRAHVTTKPHSGYVNEESSEEDHVDSKHAQSNKRRYPKKQSGETETATDMSVDLEGTFPIHISIERALHLPTVQEKGKARSPRCYVSYQTAECSDLTYTDVFTPCANPLWNHEHDTRLSVDLLQQRAKNLVFKLWHKPDGVSQQPDKSADKVLGFVSVDLSPLTSGLPQICGWYNIMDFNGLCQGQIKVSVTPVESLAGHAPEGHGPHTPPQEAPHPNPASAHQQFSNNMPWYPEPSLYLRGNKDNSSIQLQHFSEHFQNVAKHHQQLKQHMVEMGGADASSASRSLLFNNLRMNLQELDDITAKMKQRLFLPGSQQEAPVSGDDHHSYAAPLSTSSALITCTGTFNTEGALGSHEGHQWAQYAGATCSTMPNTDLEGDDHQWHQGGSTQEGPYRATMDSTQEGPYRATMDSTQEGASWLRSAVGHETHPEYLRITTAIPHPSEHFLSTQGSAYTQDEVADAMQATLDNLNSNNATGSDDTFRNTCSFETTHDRRDRTDGIFSHDALNSADQGTEYTQALQNAQNLLKAFSQQHESEANPDGLHHTRELGVSDEEGDESQHLAHHQGYRDDNELGVEEEEDTFSQHWTMRGPHEEESFLSDVGGEEVVVMPRPLNDVSSANFKNMAPSDGRKISESPSVDKNDTDDTWFTDPNDTRAVRRARSATNHHDHTANGGGTKFPLSSRVRLESSDTDKASLASKRVTDTDKASLTSKQSKERTNSRSSVSSRSVVADEIEVPPEADLLSVEDPSVIPDVSRTSSRGSLRSPRSWNVRKAAEFRRECLHAENSTSGEEDAEERRPLSHRSRRSNTSMTSTESSRRPQQLHVQDEAIVTEEAVAEEDAVTSDNDTDIVEEIEHDEGKSQPTDSESVPLVQFTPREDIPVPFSPPASHRSVGSNGHKTDTLTNGTEESQNQDDSLHSFEINEHRMEFNTSDGLPPTNGLSPVSNRSQNSKQSSKSEPPNFFLPQRDLEQTMRALRMTALPSALNETKTVRDEQVRKEKAAEAGNLTTKLTSSNRQQTIAQRLSAKNIPKPSQDQAQRIAKIFAQKFT